MRTQPSAIVHKHSQLGAGCQAVVYKSDYDVQIKLALRKGMSEDDFADNSLKEMTDDIIATLDEELNGKPKGDDDEGERKKAEEEGPVSFATAASVIIDIEKELATVISDPEGKLRKWAQYAETAIFLAFGMGAWRSCVRLGRQFSWICACLAVVSYQSR
jgi:hypothetical protein